MGKMRAKRCRPVLSDRCHIIISNSPANQAQATANSFRRTLGKGCGGKKRCHLAQPVGPTECTGLPVCQWASSGIGAATWASRPAPRPAISRHAVIPKSSASGTVHACVASRRTPKRKGPAAANR